MRRATETPLNASFAGSVTMVAAFEPSVCSLSTASSATLGYWRDEAGEPSGLDRVFNSRRLEAGREVIVRLRALESGLSS